jgi:hypothetical protein
MRSNQSVGSGSFNCGVPATVQELVDVDPRGVGHAQNPRVPSLSVCAMTRGSGRLTGVLDLLRPFATEIVVALDERAEAETARLALVADEIVLFPHRDPGDSLIAWLHAQCTSSWILNLDDDEVPSTRLLLHLPKLLAGDVTHWWLPRRWLVGGLDTVLDEPPWVPDYQLRLYRNDPASLRFSDEFHRPVVVSGPAGFARHPLWHLDCVLNSFEHRRAKALLYERARRGMRIAGIAHNGGLYLPELLPGANTARVPEIDVQLIRSVLSDPLPAGRTQHCSLRRVSRCEIDALWPGEPFDETLYTAKLTGLDLLARLPAGARHTVTVAVENRSRSTWRFGADAAPTILIGTRWLAGDGALYEHGLHTPLPADLPPGGSMDVPVHVRAPTQPGRYRLSIDLVHENVRWFDSALEWSVEVTRACRVALVGRGEPLERDLDRFQLEPRVETIIIEDGAEAPTEARGHEWVPGLGGYLLAGIDDRIGPLEIARLIARTARLLRRSRRLRAGKPSAPLPNGAEDCLRGLASCDRLHISGPDWEPDAALTRQLWRLATTAATARRLGLAVYAAPDLLTPRDARDRLLLRFVRGPR